MGNDVFQFAGVVMVAVIAGLAWRWGNVWIHRIRGETTEAIEALEERVEELERALSERRTERLNAPSHAPAPETPERVAQARD